MKYVCDLVCNINNKTPRERERENKFTIIMI